MEFIDSRVPFIFKRAGILVRFDAQAPNGAKPPEMLPNPPLTGFTPSLGRRERVTVQRGAYVTRWIALEGVFGEKGRHVGGAVK